ncbi:site-2 protease family protein [Metallumcola ferriviriculae]|uniref:Site-2 protease family protein n=1 Tax=Metallumcola ferriviriculae TaxID=3039180 RepID=A0AAU0US07_9FIRM|nr:site-2 protease family protein [Desulfitibacteraceae bacterium MK1]
MHSMDINSLLAAIPAILIAIVFHEYAHGKVAYMLGDPTPKYQKRLTLNPLNHLDPLGALMFIVVGFGWAKPVQVNPFHFRGDRRKGMMMVSLAGPVMNLVLAYLGAVGLQLFGTSNWYVGSFFQSVVLYNIVLAVFNLIPVPPLDGSKILAGLLPAGQAHIMQNLERYGTMILLLLLFTGIIGRILWPVVQVIYSSFMYLSSFALL